MASIDNGSLIEEVRKRPVIWDPTLGGEEDPSLLDAAWEELYQVFHDCFLPDQICKSRAKVLLQKRWTFLKKEYAFNYASRLRSGIHLDEPCPEFYYYHRMKFAFNHETETEDGGGPKNAQKCPAKQNTEHKGLSSTSPTAFAVLGRGSMNCLCLDRLDEADRGILVALRGRLQAMPESLKTELKAELIRILREYVP